MFMEPTEFDLFEIPVKVRVLGRLLKLAKRVCESFPLPDALRTITPLVKSIFS